MQDNGLRRPTLQPSQPLLVVVKPLIHMLSELCNGIAHSGLHIFQLPFKAIHASGQALLNTIQTPFQSIQATRKSLLRLRVLRRNKLLQIFK